MKKNIEIQVTIFLDVDIENAEELKETDNISDERKAECMAKAMEGVVSTVLNKHFENDERTGVSFVAAEPIRQF